MAKLALFALSNIACMSNLNSIGGISAECSGSVYHEYLTSALAARLLPRVPGISAPAPSPWTSPCPPRRVSPAEAWAPANTITTLSPALCLAPTTDRPRNHLRLLPEHQQLTLNPGMKVGVRVNNVSTIQSVVWANCGLNIRAANEPSAKFSQSLRRSLPEPSLG